MNKKNNFKMVYTIIGIAAFILTVLLGVQLYIAISKLFLPTIIDIAWLVGLASGTVISLAVGIRFMYIGIKTGVAIKRDSEEAAEYKSKTIVKMGLSEAAPDLAVAADQISSYLSLGKEELFRSDLSNMQGTVKALDEMFNASKQAVSRRFFNGITATKFQTGLDSLYGAVLARLNKQMLQLCAVNTAELVNRADIDAECRRSIEKLKAYVNGTKMLLDKTMGLGTRLTLDLIDCTEDDLQKETEKLIQLTAELEEYKR